MRKMSENARDLLMTASDLARLRDGAELSPRDLAMAVIVHRWERREEALPSLSPEQLHMADSVERVLTGARGPVDLAELVDLAAAENPDLAEYLGHGG
ncbi:hypothetical protein [Streptomyces mesophilus]|uniref:hypothetical protein n=1 Tax=Streptomyces mesophilus TaxID=1775132 RepID=UPI0013ED67FE|nr:hypothetical protein [Streptomyces mesophilus]